MYSLTVLRNTSFYIAPWIVYRVQKGYEELVVQLKQYSCPSVSRGDWFQDPPLPPLPPPADTKIHRCSSSCIK